MSIKNNGANAPLVDAVLCGDSATVRSLLLAGANADTRDHDIPLLTLAVIRDDLATAQALLEAGADVEAETLASRPYPDFMSAVQSTHLKKHYRALGLKIESADFYHTRAIRFAVSADMVRLLKKHGARLGTQRHDMLAGQRAADTLITALLEDEEFSLLHPDNVRGLAKAILRAAATGDTKLLKLMLQAGGNANQMLDKRRTPLHLAATPEVVRVLLAHGACLNAPDWENNTPLGTACSEAVAAELRAHGAKRTHLRPAMLPELHEAARLNRFDDVKRLCARGADINARSEYGTTPLFHATGARMTRLLLELGANALAEDEFGNTALPFIRSGTQRPLLLEAMELPPDTPQPPLPPFLPRYEVWSGGTIAPPCGIIERAVKTPRVSAPAARRRKA